MATVDHLLKFAAFAAAVLGLIIAAGWFDGVRHPLPPVDVDEPGRTRDIQRLEGAVTDQPCPRCGRVGFMMMRLEDTMGKPIHSVPARNWDGITRKYEQPDRGAKTPQPAQPAPMSDEEREQYAQLCGD